MQYNYVGPNVKCDFQIREFIADDADRVLEIRKKNLQQANSKDYSKSII